MAVDSVGRGSQLPSQGGLGMGGARSATHRARWHLRCSEGISYCVGEDSLKELGFRVNVFMQVYMRTSRILMLLSFLVKLGKARITAQLGSPLSRSHQHNDVHHFLWIKKQRQTPGALEEQG